MNDLKIPQMNYRFSYNIPQMNYCTGKYSNPFLHQLNYYNLMNMSKKIKSDFKTCFSKYLASFLMVILFLFNLNGQELSNIFRNKPFTWNGSLNAGLNTYQSSNKLSQYAPLGYQIGANVNFNVYGINIPFSITYRNRSGNYALPFSRFSIAPSYKWAKLYIGHNSVEFNPYVLSGVQIYGLGAEINPGILRFGIISGEVKNTKIIVDSLENNSGLLNPFKRKVLGLKLGIGNQSNYFDIVMLTGNDRDTIPNLQVDSIAVNKESNGVIGTSLGLTFFRHVVQIRANAAASNYTTNQVGKPLEQKDLDDNTFLRTANSLFSINQTTGIFFAGDANITINLGNVTLGGRYQRIDPYYKTFGIFLIRGDNENYSLNSSISLLKSKVNVSGSYGLNRNNVSKLRNNSVLQKVYNVNVNISPVKWFGIDAQLSNFNFNQVPVIGELNDTLRLLQINKVNSIYPYLSFSNKKVKHNIFVNINKQSIQDLSSPDFYVGNSYVDSYNLGYNFKHKIKKYGFGSSFFFNTYKSGDFSNTRKGMTATCSNTLWDNKINNRLKLTYSLIDQGAIKNKTQINLSLSSSISHNNKTMTIQAFYGSRPSFKDDKTINEFRFNTFLNIPIN